MNGQEAIQVLESIEENGKDLKKIRIIPKYENGPSLEEVFLSEDVKDLPILVFSIAGKTRGGKSFLLNLMLKYLEAQKHQNTDGWLKGTVPACFPWKEGPYSITRGLWIFPTIYRLKDKDGGEVGIMVLDNVGMNDGEITNGEMIAICGISSAISYLQMFNAKEQITSDYLESVVRNLVKGIEEMDSEEKTDLRKDYKLMFVIRDWFGEEEHPFGLQGGHNYIKRESERGTQENKKLWEIIHKTFENVECMLFPHPGIQVTKPKFTQYAELKKLEEEFLDVVKEFVETLFSPEKLVIPSNSLTGQGIYNILKNIDGKTANEDLSFLNIVSEHANYIKQAKFEKLKSDFQEHLSHVKKYSHLREAKNKIPTILQSAEPVLRGKSGSPNLTELRMALEDSLNMKVTEIVLKHYEAYVVLHKSPIDILQSKIWSDIENNFKTHICGDIETQKSATITFIKKAATHYYSLLHQQCKNRFLPLCLAKETLKDLAGLDEEEIKSFKKCEDFKNSVGDLEVDDLLWLKAYQCLKNEFLDILLKKIEDLTKIGIDTLRDLRRKQYEHFELFNLLADDEDSSNEIEVSKKILIAKKVGYALFGSPSHISAAVSNRRETVGSGSITASQGNSVFNLLTHLQKAALEGTGYSAEQENQIWPIVKKIIELTKSKNNTIKLSIVFVVYYQACNIVNVPLFRIEAKNCIKYLDSNCRLYKKWDDFLDSNTLPDTLYCYPLKGFYCKKNGFAVAYLKTPASKVINKVLKGTDGVGKCATLVAAGAGSAVVLGATAPVWGGLAVVGGIVGGGYGAFRTVLKMVDKHKHDERIKKKDYFNLLTNSIAVVGAVGAVVGRTAAYAAEGAVVLGARIAAGVASVNSLTAFFTGFNKTTNLISLIAEAEENSLRILFYFNTTCSTDALEVISKTLKLGENVSNVDCLMALVENNCVQYATESEAGEVMVEKYVSQSVVTLVTSLLTAVSSNTKENVLLYCKLCTVFQEYTNGPTSMLFMAQQVEKIMKRFLEKIQKDIKCVRTLLEKSICIRKISSSDDTIFRETLMNNLHEKDNNFLLAFMSLIHCIIGTLSEANGFYNNIDHKACSLKDHFLGDILFHPFNEITQKIKEKAEQAESAIDIEQDNIELNDFISQALNILKENSKEFWTDQQFGICLLSILEVMICHSITAIDEHKALVEKEKEKKSNLSCNDLNDLFGEIGLEGYNYGSWVLKNSLRKTEGNKDNIKKIMNNYEGTGNLTIVPAWGGILDNLYFYFSKQQILNKYSIIKMDTNAAEETYDQFKLRNNNLVIYRPCVRVHPWYIVYSNVIGGEESGLMWSFKVDDQ